VFLKIRDNCEEGDYDYDYDYASPYQPGVGQSQYLPSPAACLTVVN